MVVRADDPRRLPSPLYRMMDLRSKLQDACHAFNTAGHSRPHTRSVYWGDAIEVAVMRQGTKVVAKGRGPGSLEPEETAGLDYTVLDGEGVERHLPWLDELYKSLAPSISELLGTEVRVPEHVASRINVNLLIGKGARYEKHNDAQPYSLLLFVTKHGWGEGGRLMLGDDPSIGLVPNPGYAALFDGSVIPHTVEPLVKESTRITVPMVFLPPEAGERPADLDNYLFGDKG